MTDDTSRYVAISRRTFVKRAAALGAFALFPTLAAACGGDGDTFAGTGSTTPPTATTAGGVATTPPPSVDDTTTTAEPTTTATEVGGAVPAGGELVVRFTYSAEDDGGRVENPYIAVWVENADGDLVDTIALWLLQSQKGLKWLSDLRRWNRVDGSDASVGAISSATRTPGDYTVVWDGTDLDGVPVARGEYFICIESAREHGPYSLIREPVAIDGTTLTADLPEDGELSNASVELIAA